MAAKFLDSEDIEDLMRARASDPFSLLGFHRLENKLKTAAIRALNPSAREMSVRAAGKDYPMAKLHPAGLFEAFVPEDARPYSLVEGGREYLDPYAFGPTIGEFDSHLVLEGKHYDLHAKLGARIVEHEGVGGTAFAVLAPHALRVSVVGDFNNWDGRVNMMRRHPVGGIWDIFIPGLGAGALYKFEILSRDGKVLPLKSDPFARLAELRPGTASVVWQSDYEWLSAPPDTKTSIAEPVSI
ncbi:MAG: hypothetical protein LBL52_02060, partial [Rickettsiales bacterium]|nr:hypothetical protein [Rickettsiales bacterium]